MIGRLFRKRVLDPKWQPLAEAEREFSNRQDAVIGVLSGAIVDAGERLVAVGDMDGHAQAVASLEDARAQILAATDAFRAATRSLRD